MALQGTGSAVNGWTKPFYLTGNNYPITLAGWVKIPTQSFTNSGFFGLGGSNALAYMLFGDSVVTSAVFAGSGGSVTDGAGGVWTIVSGQALRNGSLPVFSSGVICIAIVGGVARQINNGGQFYQWTGSAWSAQYNDPLSGLFLDLFDDTGLEAGLTYFPPPGYNIPFISDGAWHHIGAQIITNGAPSGGDPGGIFWLDGVRSTAPTTAGFNLGAQTFTSLQIGVAPTDGGEPAFLTTSALAEICVFSGGPGPLGQMDQVMQGLARGVSPLRIPGKQNLLAYHPLRSDFRDFGPQRIGFAPLGTAQVPVWVNHPPLVETPPLLFRRMPATHAAVALAGTGSSADSGATSTLSTGVSLAGTGSSTDSVSVNLLASGIVGRTQGSVDSATGFLSSQATLVGTTSSIDSGLGALSGTAIPLASTGLAISSDAAVGFLTTPAIAANTQQLQNALVDAVIRGQPLQAPSNWFIALVTQLGDPITPGLEVSGGGYARATVAASLTAWSGTQGQSTTLASFGVSGLVSNNQPITFPTSTTSWGTVVGYEFWDQPSGGNRWLAGKLGNTLTIGSGQTRSFPIGSLSVAIA